MLLREEPDGGILAIAQPAHAALAGRLAQAWDDDVPDGLRVATAHHDDVWAAWDAAPHVNPANGRPLTFPELEPDDRVRVWSPASAVAAPLGPEAELWILRHAARLHQGAEHPELRAMTASFTARAAVLVAELRDEQPGRFDDAELARGTSLLALFDALSLALCFGVVAPRDAGVLRLTPADGGAAAAAGAVTVAPWPFAGRRVDSFVEVRRLPVRLAGQAALDAAWAAAVPLRVAVTLLASP